MHYFVSIISEATPILECSFESIGKAKQFYENLLKGGYSLSYDDYEILFGSYSLDIEQETIIEQFTISHNKNTKLKIGIADELLNLKLNFN